MKDLLKRVYLKLKHINQWRPKVEKCDNLITLGSKYGSWTIPDNLLTQSSVVYLAGAGEDISFDAEVVERYSCEVNIFDPTPRAKKHYQSVIEGVNNGEKVAIDKNKTNFYKLSKEKLDKLKFHEIGLWDKQDELKFFVPKNPEHVSHSIVNLQKTKDHFVAKVDRLSNIMRQLNHSEIDLLKIDIEGAEYKVIESIIEDKLKIKVLCVEYDEAYNPLDDNYLGRIKASLEKLMEYGYKVVDLSLKHNYTLILK